MKPASFRIFQKSVVVILLLNLFLSMTGVSAQNSQVDCSKLAFNPDDMPQELQPYAKNPIKDVSAFISSASAGDFPGRAGMIFAGFAQGLNPKPECTFFSAFGRALRIRTTYSDGSSKTEIARRSGNDIRSAVLAFSDESTALSIYSQFSPDLKNVKEEVIADEQVNFDLVFTDQATENYGEESTSWLIIGSQAGHKGTVRRLCSFFRIKSVLLFFFAGWNEGQWVQSGIDELGNPIEILDPITLCEDAGLIALRNWSERLLRELSGVPPPPPVTTGQCSIMIDGGFEGVAVDGVSTLTFKGTFEATDPNTIATSVFLNITADVAKPPPYLSWKWEAALPSPIKEVLEDKEIRLEGNSFKYDFDAARLNLSSRDLRPGNARLEATFKDGSGKEIAKCFKDFTLVNSPVVLVHGIWASSYYMDRYMGDYFRRWRAFKYVFTFNYGDLQDWRKGANGDINEYAVNLSKYIEKEVVGEDSQLQKDKVRWSGFDIVAHSAGGLIARQYIYMNPEHRVRNLVTIATPHGGSPSANVLAYFRNKGAAGKKIPYEERKDEDRNRWLPLRTWPHVPNIADRRSTMVDYSTRIEHLEKDSTRQGENWVEIGDYGIVVEQLTVPEEVTTDAEKGQVWFQLPGKISSDDIGPLYETERRAGFFINEINNDAHLRTLEGISILCLAGTLHPFMGFYNIPNDGIVTENSALLLARKMQERANLAGALGGRFVTESAYTGAHSYVKDRYEVMTRVVTFLNDPSQLAVRSQSPVRIHVYDKDDRHTGLKSDGTLEVEIPNSDYFEEDGSSNIIVYGGGDYRVVYEAYDDGDATFSITKQETEEGLKVVSYRSVKIRKAATYNVAATSSPEAPMLEVDLDDDGDIDEKIQPSDYQYFPPKTETGDGQDGGREGFDTTIAVVAIIIVFIVALLIAKRDTALAYVQVFAGRKGTKSVTQVHMPAETTTCSRCGTMNPSTSRYCTKCGGPLRGESFCEECGRTIPSGSTYCPVCGDKQGAA